MNPFGSLTDGNNEAGDKRVSGRACVYACIIIIMRRVENGALASSEKGRGDDDDVVKCGRESCQQSSNAKLPSFGVP